MSSNNAINQSSVFSHPSADAELPVLDVEGPDPVSTFSNTQISVGHLPKNAEPKPDQNEIRRTQRRSSLLELLCLRYLSQVEAPGQTRFGIAKALFLNWGWFSDETHAAVERLLKLGLIEVSTSAPNSSLQQLKLTTTGTEKLEKSHIFRYVEKLCDRLLSRTEYLKGLDGDSEEDPRDKKDLDESLAREFLKFLAQEAPPEVTIATAEHAREEQPELAERFAKQSTPNVPLWADRTPNRQVTPVDFIKTHYGRWVNDRWDSQGLTRAQLRQNDPKLYQAFNTQISRLRKKDQPIPEDMLPLLETTTEALDKLLEEESLHTVGDIQRKYRNDPQQAERLRSALRRRM